MERETHLSNNHLGCIMKHYKTHNKVNNNDITKLFGDKSNEEIFELLYQEYNEGDSFEISSSEKEVLKETNELLSAMIAKHKKYYQDGNFIKKLMVLGAKKLFPNNPGIYKKFEKLSLNLNTVKKNINKIANNLENNLLENIKTFDKISITFDEITDNVNYAQVPFFIRGVTNNFTVQEHFLDLVQIELNCTGESYKELLINLKNKYNLNFEKVVSISTDSARSLVGQYNGAVSLFKKYLIDLNCEREVKHFSCIIHQVNLCCEQIEIDNVVEKISETINDLKSRGFKNRKFRHFLKTKNCKLTDVLRFSKTRWLSRARSFKRFYVLIELINEYYISQNNQQLEFSSPQFRIKLAFLVDFTKQLNELNLIFMYKNNNILIMYKKLIEFQNKLHHFDKEFKSNQIPNNFTYLQNELLKTNITFTEFEKFACLIQNIASQFNKRFIDFKAYNDIFNIYLNPFNNSIVIPRFLVTEIEKLRNNYSINNFDSQNCINFFMNLPSEFFNLKDTLKEVLSMYGTSYSCEQFFSKLSFRKNKYTSRISNSNLVKYLRVSTYYENKSLFYL